MKINDRFYRKQKMLHGTQSCDIVLTRNYSVNPFENWLRDAICKQTNGIFSHAFLVGKSGEIIDAQASGIKIKKMSDYIHDRMSFIVFRPDDISESDKKCILSYAYGSVGRNYDFAGLFSFLFSCIKQKPDANFCSENVVEAYRTLPLNITTNPSMPSPNTISDYMYLQLKNKFEGVFHLHDSQNLNVEEYLAFMKIIHGE